jgi:hypothetical protein
VYPDPGSRRAISQVNDQWTRSAGGTLRVQVDLDYEDLGLRFVNGKYFDIETAVGFAVLE